MANRTCCGDFFIAEGVPHYCCFWDSAVVQDQPRDQPCRNCGRPITAEECGEVAVEVSVVATVQIGRRRVELQGSKAAAALTAATTRADTLQAEKDAAEARCGELAAALREMIQSHDCVEGRQACICDRCIRAKAILARTPAAAAERVKAMEAVCEAADRYMTASYMSRAEHDAIEELGVKLAALARLDAAGGDEGPDAPAPDPS